MGIMGHEKEEAVGDEDGQNMDGMSRRKMYQNINVIIGEKMDFVLWMLVRVYVFRTSCFAKRSRRNNTYHHRAPT